MTNPHLYNHQLGASSSYGVTNPTYLCTECGRESVTFFSHCSHKSELSEVSDTATTKRRFRFLHFGRPRKARKNQ